METKTTSGVPKTITDYFAATRAMDREAWVSQFAETGCSHDPVGAPPHVGREALGRFFDSIVSLLETVGLHEDAVYACGNEVAVKWTGRGRGRNGKPVVFEGIDVFELDERGRIKTLRAYWDPSRLFAQLG